MSKTVKVESGDTIVYNISKKFCGGQVKIKVKDISMDITLSQHGKFTFIPKDDRRTVVVMSFV
jgi:hypothetical protein